MSLICQPLQTLDRLFVMELSIYDLYHFNEERDLQLPNHGTPDRQRGEPGPMAVSSLMKSYGSTAAVKISRRLQNRQAKPGYTAHQTLTSCCCMAKWKGDWSEAGHHWNKPQNRKVIPLESRPRLHHRTLPIRTRIGISILWQPAIAHMIGLTNLEGSEKTQD